MKPIIPIICILLFLTGYTGINAPAPYQHSNAVFTRELAALKNYFHIPGLAVIVTQGDSTLYESYTGYADMDRKIAMDSTTLIPMASLTKIFTGVLMLQLVEENKLSLDEPVNKYITHKNIPDSILIKHVLSHTSQGEVGKHFYYSTRFSWLTAVIEKAGKQTFEHLLQEKILRPLNMTGTFLLKDSSQLFSQGRQVAMPYIYEGETKQGFIDYGYSAAAGIVSTIRDMALFNKALDNNTLITPHSKAMMFTPFRESLPYGYGIFSQQLFNRQLVWAYGQYDCYSSLFLKVPANNITLIIAANNNLLSDPARLIYGDAGSSLFALSFLKNYVLHLSDIPLLENQQSLTTLKSSVTPLTTPLYIKKLIAQSTAASFLAPFDADRYTESKNILEQVFNLFPDYQTYTNLTLLHTLSFLKEVAQQQGAPEFTGFDKQLLTTGLQLAATDSDNPYVNYYLASYYQQKNRKDSARFYYNKIITAPNFSKNWYTTEAAQQLQ